MKWESTDAFKLGLIDENGKRIRKPKTSEEKAAYTLFHRLVYNIKRLIQKLPGGLTRRLASFASALYLIREHLSVEENAILEHMGIKFDLDEQTEEKGLLENRRYQLNKDILIPIEEEAYACSGTTVTIIKSVGKAFGSTIYEARHNLSDRIVYVSEADIAADLFQEEFSVSTADVAMPPMPLKAPDGRKYQRFVVPTATFQKFDRGRKKWQRWKVFLDVNDEKQYQIAQFARRYRKALIILQDETTGAMRAIRPTSSDGT